MDKILSQTCTSIVYFRKTSLDQRASLNCIKDKTACLAHFVLQSLPLLGHSTCTMLPSQYIIDQINIRQPKVYFLSYCHTNHSCLCLGLFIIYCLRWQWCGGRVGIGVGVVLQCVAMVGQKYPRGKAPIFKQNDCQWRKTLFHKSRGGVHFRESVL